MNLASLSTMKIGGTVQKVVHLSIDEIQDFFKKEKPKNWMVLGEGSNTVFEEGEHDVVIIQIKDTSIQKIKEDSDSVYLKVDAGCNWDVLVEHAVSSSYAGIEALSHVPGSVGAAPVQNIGAYGVEFSDVVESVSVFDVEDMKYKVFTKDECDFSYRNSIFKKNKGRYLVTSVVLCLKNAKTVQIPQYRGVQDFLKKDIATLTEIRNAIIYIRSLKLPNPKILANCGSFFKNAYLTEDEYLAKKELFKDAPIFEVDNGIKVPSAWLIEQAGLKGYCVGGVCTSENHALVIINKNNGSFSDLEGLIETIISRVDDMFGIVLEPEVQIIYRKK